MLSRRDMRQEDPREKIFMGGHSLRTGGAVFLASLGLDVHKIQLLGRWFSTVVERYVALAPLKTVTKDVRRLLRSLVDETGADEEEARATLKTLRSCQNTAARLPENCDTMRELYARIEAIEQQYNDVHNKIE